MDRRFVLPALPGAPAPWALRRLRPRVVMVIPPAAAARLVGSVPIDMFPPAPPARAPAGPSCASAVLTPNAAWPSTAPDCLALASFWKYFWACVRICTTVRDLMSVAIFFQPLP